MDEHLNHLKQTALDGKLAVIIGSGLCEEIPWVALKEKVIQQLEENWSILENYMGEIRERDIPVEALFRILYKHFGDDLLDTLECFQTEQSHPLYQAIAQKIKSDGLAVFATNIDNRLQTALAKESVAWDDIVWQEDREENSFVACLNGIITTRKSLQDNLGEEEHNFLSLTQVGHSALNFLEGHESFNDILVLGLAPGDFCWRQTFGKIMQLAKKGKNIYWVTPAELPQLQHLQHLDTVNLISGNASEVFAQLIGQTIEPTENASIDYFQSFDSWLEEIAPTLTFLEFGAYVLNYLVSRTHSYEVYKYLLSEYEAKKQYGNVANVLRCMGKILFEQGYMSDAIEAHVQAIEYWSLANDDYNMALEYVCVGDNYWNASAPDKAVQHYGEALSLFRQKGDNEGISKATSKLALICDSDEDFDLAHRYYLESLQAKRKIGDNLGLISNLLNLSATLIKEQDWNRAKKYLEEALTISENHNCVSIEEIYQHLGLVFMNTQDYKMARNYYEKVYDLYKEQNEELALTFVYCNLGHVCVRLEDYESAIDHYEDAMGNYEKMGDWQHLAAVFNNLGFINSNRKNYNDAEEYFARSAEIFAALQDVYNLIRAHGNLARVYTMKNDLENAAECYRANIEMLSQLDEKEELASTLVAYAMVQLHSEQHEDAMSKLQSAVEIYDILGLSKEKEDALQILNTIEAKISQ